MKNIEFVDIKDKDKESVHGVRVDIKDESSIVGWTYPMDYSQVCIFEIPLKTEFSEADAISGKYSMYYLKHPTDEFKSNTVCNFAILPVDKNGMLVRQHKCVYRAPIKVKWRVGDEKIMTYAPERRRGVISSLFGFNRKESQTEQYEHYIEFESNIEIEGKKICYHLVDSETGMPDKSMIFCLPADIVPGNILRLKMPWRIVLFSEEDNIELEQKI